MNININTCTFFTTILWSIPLKVLNICWNKLPGAHARTKNQDMYRCARKDKLRLYPCNEVSLVSWSMILTSSYFNPKHTLCTPSTSRVLRAFWARSLLNKNYKNVKKNKACELPLSLNIFLEFRINTHEPRVQRPVQCPVSGVQCLFSIGLKCRHYLFLYFWNWSKNNVKII